MTKRESLDQPLAFPRDELNFLNRGLALASIERHNAVTSIDGRYGAWTELVFVGRSKRDEWRALLAKACDPWFQPQ